MRKIHQEGILFQSFDCGRVRVAAAVALFILRGTVASLLPKRDIEQELIIRYRASIIK
jgi:hypothetical protein